MVQLDPALLRTLKCAVLGCLGRGRILISRLFFFSFRICTSASLRRGHLSERFRVGQLILLFSLLLIGQSPRAGRSQRLVPFLQVPLFKRWHGFLSSFRYFTETFKSLRRPVRKQVRLTPPLWPRPGSTSAYLCRSHDSSSCASSFPFSHPASQEYT